MDKIKLLLVSFKMHLRKICCFHCLLFLSGVSPSIEHISLQMIRLLYSTLLRINCLAVILVNIAVIPLWIPDKVINGPLQSVIDKHRGFGTLGSVAVFEGLGLQACNSDLRFVVLSGSCREM